MQAPHVDYAKLSWTGNTAEIFSRREIYFFLSAAEDICGSPILELAIEGYQTTRMLPEKFRRHFEV